MPSVARARQCSFVVHCTAVTAAAPAGAWPTRQRAPPTTVERTAPGAPADPTATQSCGPTHEMAARAVTEVGTVCGVHFVPPSVVASIEAVVPVPNPTAQQ